jgi:AraC-like DNA-binding protein
LIYIKSNDSAGVASSAKCHPLAETEMPWSRVLSFSDPLACQAAVQGSETEILPTAKGNFLAEITQIGMNKLWLQRFKFALPQVTTIAKAPNRRAIGFLDESNSSNFQHHGMDVGPNEIYVFDPNVVHQRSGFGAHFAVMSLPLQDFSYLCGTIVGRELLEKPQASIVRPDPALLSRLLRLHRKVGQLAHDSTDILDLPEVRRALEEQLIHAMVRCLADGVSVEATTGRRRHDAIIARFEEFLAANSDRPLYLTEICAAIGVGERTLRTSCEEHLGMGPIRFLTLRRMHLARRVLLRTDPQNATVTRIATDHGFWELGRFAVVYRALFGESPSKTLRRPAERTAVHLDRPSSLAAAQF